MNRENRGGKRAGAGRPAKEDKRRRIVTSVRLEPWLLNWLKSQEETSTQLIERALIGFYGLTLPTDSDDVEERYCSECGKEQCQKVVNITSDHTEFYCPVCGCTNAFSVNQD
ncbi:hypothetical protein AZH90_004330 [Salmonella enterica subsp. enterica serovar Legon]|nr:hypothetical protein [Salmonella enterica subsp. enterica serovar Legon]EDW9825394.1 hypothetical protein [Salmonella enterica]EDZ3589446.1 hypothetical protein [Salmonella enterica subsp. enterica serovar Wagenia]